MHGTYLAQPKRNAQAVIENCLSSLLFPSLVRILILDSRVQRKSIVNSRTLEGESPPARKDKAAQPGKRRYPRLETHRQLLNHRRQQVADKVLLRRLYREPRRPAAAGVHRRRWKRRLVDLEHELQAAARLRVAGVHRLDGVVGAPVPVEGRRVPGRGDRRLSAVAERGELVADRHGEGAADGDRGVAHSLLGATEGRSGGTARGRVGGVVTIANVIVGGIGGLRGHAEA